MKERQGFKSSQGMIMAAVGSAVGVGNVWRFPYIVGKYGGGAFLIIYLFLIAIIGVPLMISEIAIGRKAQSDAIGSFKKLEPGKKWYLAGVVGVTAAFLILGYYSVVAGWTLKYTLNAITNSFAGKNPAIISEMFGGFVSATVEPIVWMLIFMGTTIFIVSRGVQAGIEKAAKIVLPILFVILIILAGVSLSLDGAMEGINYLFKPDFSTLTFEGVLAAMGHAFYTLSLGMGIMITYGSYMSKKVNLLSTVVTITALDTGVALLAGLAIFPAVFSFGLEPSEGAGLVFTVLPNIFEQMPMGYIFGVLFFILLAFAALTSTISLLEVVVAYLVDSRGMERKKASYLAGLGIILVGVVSSLSMGPWGGIKIFDKNFFDFFDHLTANYLLLIAAFIEIIYLGWFIKKEDFINMVSKDGITKVKSMDLLHFLIKIIVPVVIAVIFISSNLLYREGLSIMSTSI